MMGAALTNSTSFRFPLHKSALNKGLRQIKSSESEKYLMGSYILFKKEILRYKKRYDMHSERNESHCGKIINRL